MAQYDNVSVVKKANVYFDGKVSSRTVILENGDKITLGVVLPGEYKFDTGAPEVMEVIAGALEVQLAGETTWTTYEADQAFDVPANSSFTMVSKGISEYCCYYKK